MIGVTLTVEGMHCDACAETVKALLDSEPGVRASEVTFAEGSARVLYDPVATDEARLIAAIEKGGFTVAGRRR